MEILCYACVYGLFFLNRLFCFMLPSLLTRTPYSYLPVWFCFHATIRECFNVIELPPTSGNNDECMYKTCFSSKRHPALFVAWSFVYTGFVYIQTLSSNWNNSMRKRVAFIRSNSNNSVNNWNAYSMCAVSIFGCYEKCSVFICEPSSDSSFLFSPGWRIFAR